MIDDQELMTAIQAGNSRAYESVVKRHLKSISHYAFRMLGNTKDTEDITQETFLVAWRKLPGLELASELLLKE